MADTRRPRSVLITGASSGIGHAVALQLAKRGDRVFGTSRKPRDPDETGIEWLVMDVCDAASVEAAVREADEKADGSAGEKLGGLDAAVLCAGFGIFGSVEDVTLEAAQAQFETNYFGMLRSLRALLPRMRTRGSGRILIVGSLAGRLPIPFQSHYSASKAAVDATVQSLRNELLGTGVEVSLIEPGDISTPFNDAMDWGASPGDSAYREHLEKCEKVIRENLPKAPGAEIVVRAVEKALDARSPAIRYPVGAEVPWVPLAKRLLPESWAVRFIGRYFGLG